jgi:hypothetical protein
MSARRPLQKNGFGGQLLKQEVDCANLGASSMNDIRWDSDALPWLETKFAAIGKINKQTSFEHNKQFV